MEVEGEAFVERFMGVFNDRDPEAIAGMMTDDVVLEVSFGKEPFGERIVGAAAVRAFYVDMFARIPDAHWAEVRHLVGPGHVVVESVATGTPRGGPPFEFLVCDVLTLRDGKIAAKRSYRKAPPI